MTTKGHGRRTHWRLQVSDRLAGHLNWPGLAQVARLVRTSVGKGEPTVEIQYAITSVPRSKATAKQVLSWWRDHWHIENRLHWVRDTAYREDHCRVRSGHGPHNLAALRNAAISLLRLAGVTNITAALRQNAYRIDHLFARMGILKL